MRYSILPIIWLAATIVASAEDLAFLDGRVWLDVKVITKDVSFVIVKHAGGIKTVHADELHPGTASMLGIRPLTADEKTEKDKQELLQREAAAARLEREVREEAAARERATEIQAERANAPKAPLTVVTESCSVVYSRRWINSPPPITKFSGRILARVEGGAIAQGDGMPSGNTLGDFGWVQGMCFIHQTAQLNATTGGSPITSRVVPAGEYRYTDSQGVVHVLRAWRLLN